MPRTRLHTFLWGLVLFLIGVAALLYNFGIFAQYQLLAAYIAAGALALAGLGFLIFLAFRRDEWLFVIPGVSFLGLGSIVYLSTIETIRPEWLGALFLASMATGFLILFLSNRRDRWWAILQAGTIAVIALVGLGMGAPAGTQHRLGAALFGGFALSFLLLFLLGGAFRRFLWALVMAGVLFMFALTVLAAGIASPTAAVIVRLWPILVILLGSFFFFRLITGRAGPKPTAPPIPVEAVERPPSALAPVVESAPARITRPGHHPAPPLPPAPPAAADLPADLRSADLSDPGAALDALLEASRQGDK